MALDALSAEVDALRAECVAGEAAYSAELSQAHPSCRDSARNLVHYLVLRRADRRALQAVGRHHKDVAAAQGRRGGGPT